MFLIPALVSFTIAYRDPSAGAALFPGIEQRIEDIRDKREWWKEINSEGRAASSSFIMTNNIRVAILAFAGGMLLGVLSLFILAQNGLMLGIVESLGAAFVAPAYQNAYGFVLLLLVLLIRPSGLFGERVRQA